MLKISKWFIVCALVVSIGGHWVVLQSVAWVGMTFSFSQECSIQQALTKTFDGKHPCQLCKVVRAGKKAEATDESKVEFQKVDLLSDAILTYQFPEAVRQKSSLATTRVFRAETPPSPPPRQFLG
ncbi:MAG: hypothetical protein JWM68_3367 [Verrucomicrobiales bacterium]|nr:hypothetical protein [Verrucomicrobiales bacterium]